ncbi:MAG: V-type ATP synthase subunit F [Spirochaetaceae bacterium]|jgi:V/A-type H+-transporting ATPase subunit F|nr:V-type ATP synthase subunit F [Spirochaetaceae bacterium]
MDYFFLGSGELLTAFRFAGVDGAAVENRDEALAAFQRVTGAGEARILIVEESTAAVLDEEIVAWQLTGQYPLVAEIPGLAGHLKGRRTLVDAIREAIGIHV